VVGGVVLALGLLAMTVGATTGSGQGALLVGLGTIVTLVGAAVLSPLIAGPVISVLGALYPRLFGTVGRLALDNAHRQPRRTAATASALMIGLALVSALTIFATSTSASVNQAIDKVVGAEFIVTNQAQRPFPATVGDDAAAVPGVSSVSAVQQLPAQVDGDSTFLTGIDPQTLQGAFTLTFTEGGWDSIATGTFALDDQAVADQKLALGDQVTFTLPGGESQKLTLSAVYDGAAGLTGYVVSSDTLRAAGLTLGDSVLYVSVDDGADAAVVQQDLEKALSAYPTVDVQSQAQFKESIQSNVNQLLAVMVLLLSLAILIAVLGIVNTLVLSVIERTREIGLLRAVGALRQQVRRMVVLEAVVIAAFGAVLGLVLGIGFAVALQRTLVEQGITILSIPWTTMVIFFVLAALVGALAALWPAFRAGRLDVLQAVTTE
jgi:putative ABC transport system permease protein